MFCLQTQDAYAEYLRAVRKLFSNNFWRVFSSVYDQRVVIIDRVLRETRDVFVPGTHRRKKFPCSVRQLRSTILNEAGDFPAYVLHDVTIDLRGFGFRLPGNLNECKFRFINPLWAWVQAANDMAALGHTMHFEPKTMVHETSGERIYGAGVQFGDALKFAALKTPPNSKPALFGISFDGGDSGVSDRNVYPICVSVLNYNGADPVQCGLVGFIPALDVPASFKGRKEYRLARAHVMQKCIGAVIDEIENVARDGFTARIGASLSRYHPFLVAVRVDSKERKTYFGLKSDRYSYILIYAHICSYMSTHI